MSPHGHGSMETQQKNETVHKRSCFAGSGSGCGGWDIDVVVHLKKQKDRAKAIARPQVEFQGHRQMHSNVGVAPHSAKL